MSNARPLTPTEVASLVRTTPKTTYAMISGGQLPGAAIIGRQWRSALSPMQRVDEHRLACSKITGSRVIFDQ